MNGIWIPLITPFLNDNIDYESFRNLMDHYTRLGISGIIANATTGENVTLSDQEFETLANKTVEYANKKIPVYYGVGGNCTRTVIQKLKIAERANVDGILSVSPYFNRPDQKGLYAHFKAISEATTLPVVLYNIPIRTGRNMENETILRLSELKNIVGLKDSCGDAKQSIELLALKPDNFSIMTGEDILFLNNLAHGGDGGILASAHINTDSFVKIYECIKHNHLNEAGIFWKKMVPLIHLLFKEPNPAPLKYLLFKMGSIQSGELRLPLTEISYALQNELDDYFLHSIKNEIN